MPHNEVHYGMFNFVERILPQIRPKMRKKKIKVGNVHLASCNL
jgi:hypothetical protein